MSKEIRRMLIVVFLILTGVFAFLTWYSAQAGIDNQQKYTVKVYPKEKTDPNSILTAGQQMGYTGTTKKVTRFKNIKIGYKLVFYLDDKEALSNMKERLDSKKVECRIQKNDQNGQLYIQGFGNFATKQKAEAKIKALKTLTYWEFEVEDNFKKEPYQAQAVIFMDVPESVVKTMKENLPAAGAEDIEAIPGAKKSGGEGSEGEEK